MRPANSAYDTSVNRSLEQARDLLSQYNPGDVIPHERVDEEIDDLGFNEVIRPQTVEVPSEGYRVRDSRKIAEIFQEATGLYHWCDYDEAEASGMLFSGGRGHQTKAEAMRAAAFDGYTHATGSGTYWEGIKRIPAQYTEA